MWRVGQDATLRMTLGALLILDRPPTPGGVGRTVDVRRRSSARGCGSDPTTRPRCGPARRGSTTTILPSSPTCGRLSVAAPGSTRQVLDLVGLLEAIPFDPQRSPWDVTLIEGLEGGRAAIVPALPSCAHRRCRRAPAPRAAARRTVVAACRGARRLATTRAAPVRGRGVDDRRRAAARGTITITIDVGKSVRRFLDRVNAARDVAPVESAVRGVQRSLDLANSRLAPADGDRRPAGRHARRIVRCSATSRSSRSTAHGPPRWRSAAAATTSSSRPPPLASAATTSKLGTPTAELRLATPTGQGHGDEIGGNWFAPARLEVPTAVGRPGPQFGIVAERLAQARREPALRVASTVAATLGRLPLQVLAAGAARPGRVGRLRRHRASLDCAANGTSADR